MMKIENIKQKGYTWEEKHMVNRFLQIKYLKIPSFYKFLFFGPYFVLSRNNNVLEIPSA